MGVLKSLFVNARGKARLWLWLAGGFLCLYFGLFTFVLPPVLRGPLQNSLSSALGAQCSIGRLSYQPLSCTLSMYDIRLRYPDGTDFLQAAELRLRPGADLLRLTPAIGSLTLVRPSLSLALLEDGGLSTDAFSRGASEREASGNVSNAAPFPFVVKDVIVEGGFAVLEDRLRNVVHTISEVELGAPFASTLERDQEKDVQPYLRGKFNGQPFSLVGYTRPFSQTRRTEFEIKLTDITLDQFQHYLASFTTLQLRGGEISASLSLGLHRTETGGSMGSGPLEVLLSGRLDVKNVVLAEMINEQAVQAGEEARPVFSLQSGGIALERFFRAGATEVVLDKVVLEGAHVFARRDAQGQLNWQGYFKKSAPADPSAARAGVDFLVKHLTVAEGSLLWQDDALSAPYRQEFKGISGSISQLSASAGGGGSYALSLELPESGEVLARGHWGVTPLELLAELDLRDIGLQVFNPYLRELGKLDLGPGRLNEGQGVVRLTATPSGQMLFAVQKGQISLNGLRINSVGGGEDIGIAGAELSEINLDQSARQVSMGSLKLQNPVVRLQRDKEGGVRLYGLTGATGATGSQRAAVAARNQSANAVAEGRAAPWRVELNSLNIAKGELLYSDVAKPALPSLKAADISLSASGVSNDAAKPVKLDFTAKLEGGSAVWTGNLFLSPFGANGRLTLESLPLKSVAPYLGIAPNYALNGGLSCALNLKSTHIQSGGLSWSLEGGASLGGLSITEKGKEVLAWAVVHLRGLYYSSEDRVLRVKEVEGVRPRLHYVLRADGQSNLSAGLSALKEEEASSNTGGLPAGLNEFTLDKLTLREGILNFKDERPEIGCEVTLKEFGASLSGISSIPGSAGEFQLSGILDSAPMKGSGTLGIFQGPLSLQATIVLDGLDLTPLSPYALKYVGYPVLRGKLYLNTSLNIADEEMLAENTIRLARMELGEQDTRPGAPNLPLKFSLAMLEDAAQGVTVHLPVQGRLNDPQFSSGGLAGRVVGNLALSIVASPFSLLGAIFRGGHESVDLEFIIFAPGDDRLDDKAMQTATSALAALYSRPRLNLTLAGIASLEEGDAMADLTVKRSLQSAKYRSLSRADRQGVQPGDLVIGAEVNAAEYADLLFAVYNDQIENKELDDAGRVRRLPAEDLLRILREQNRPSPEGLKGLALKRAKVARDYMLSLDPTLAPRIELKEVIVHENDAQPGGRVKLGGSSR